MKNIIISEDNDMKYNDIVETLNSMNLDFTITRTESVKETIISAITNKYDFLIQDMQLPLYSDSNSYDIQTDGGANIIESLKFRNQSIPTIVISSSDEARSILDMYSLENIDNELYDPCTSLWSDNLIKFINNIYKDSH